MRTRGLGQRIALFDVDVDRAGDHQVEEFLRRRFEARARHDVSGQRRARQVERSFCARMPIATPVTAPEALPKLTIRPRGSIQSNEPSQVVLPTPS